MKTSHLLKWSVGAFLLAIVCWMARVTISYSAICVECLQHFNGVQKQVFGITYYHVSRPNQNHRRLASPDALGPGIPAINPALYEEIFGRKCKHSYQRLGMCKYSMGGVGCYGGGGRMQPQLQAKEEVFQTYARVKEADLARSSFKVVDRLGPQIKEYPDKWSELQAFSDTLAFTTSKEQWQSLIASQVEGRLLIDDPRKDFKRLCTALSNSDARIRVSAVERLADLNQVEAWEQVGRMLSDPDVSARAADRILGAQYRPLLGAALRHYGQGTPGVDKVVWPFPSSLWPWHSRLSKEQIVSLLELKDPWVDSYCFPHIWFSNSLDIAENMLAALNERPTPAAKFWLQELIAGPWPFYPLDPSEPVPVHQLGPQVTINDARWHSFEALLTNAHFGPFDTKSKPYQIRREVVELARQHRPENWAAIQVLTGQWIQETGDPVLTAAYAQAMHASDVKKTQDWIADNLKSNTNSPRRECILAAAGAVANSNSLPELERLNSSAERAAALTAQERGYLDYALHRCRRIHDWKLLQLADGKYIISRP